MWYCVQCKFEVYFNQRTLLKILDFATYISFFEPIRLIISLFNIKKTLFERKKIFSMWDNLKIIQSNCIFNLYPILVWYINETDVCGSIFVHLN